MVGSALTAAIAGGVLAYGVRGRSARLLAPSVHCGPRTRRAIALTFDDGPSPATPRLLDLLARYDAKATFFQCGMHVRRLPNITRMLVEQGHEAGNHTDTHPLLCFRSPGFMRQELQATQQAIAEASGVRPVLFRAPYGVRWFGMGAVQRRLGLLGVMWTTIALDWKLSTEAITARLLRQAENGAIFCLHDGRERQHNPDITSTLQAVERLLPILREQGYRLETVSQLLCPTT